MPEQLKGKSIMMNLYGNGAHMIAYQVNESTISWA
jgi:salicylate hydroxylase